MLSKFSCVLCFQMLPSLTLPVRDFTSAGSAEPVTTNQEVIALRAGASRSWNHRVEIIRGEIGMLHHQHVVSKNLSWNWTTIIVS